MKNTLFSDYIIYVDESGDHGLLSVNKEYPVFALAFCIFEKQEYYQKIVPAFKKLKFDFFGHDAIILHSHAMRKAKDDFIVLRDIVLRKMFLSYLSQVMATAQFTVISTVIDKIAFKSRYANAAHPYNIALQFCMERAYFYLKAKSQHQLTTHIVIERRGREEDRELERVFRSITQKNNMLSEELSFEPVFADKKHNSIGLQIADMVAYPIGQHVIRPGNDNYAYNVVKEKFYRNQGGSIEGYGLKIFPQEKREGFETSRNPSADRDRPIQSLLSETNS